MSAFVVDDDCMTRVVQAICSMGDYSPLVNLMDGTPTRQADSATKIGRRLFEMNIEAVTQRYPDCKADPSGLPGPVDDQGKSIAHDLAAMFSCITPQGKLDTAELIVALKSMECLAYQCMEGNVPETDLYKALNEAIGKVAIEIVHRMPAYQLAPWG